jgi:hypothetical protein
MISFMFCYCIVSHAHARYPAEDRDAVIWTTQKLHVDVGVKSMRRGCQYLPRKRHQASPNKKACYTPWGRINSLSTSSGLSYSRRAIATPFFLHRRHYKETQFIKLDIQTHEGVSNVNSLVTIHISWRLLIEIRGSNTYGFFELSRWWKQSGFGIRRFLRPLVRYASRPRFSYDQ